MCRRAFGILFALAGLAIPMPAAASTVVFQENFEDSVWVIGNQVDVAGPLSWVLYHIPTYGTATIEASQIGSGGSKSMDINDFTIDSAYDCRIQMTSAGLNGWNSNQGVARGTIQFDYRCLAGSNLLTHNVFIYDDAPAPDTTPTDDNLLVGIAFRPAGLFRINARNNADTANATFDSPYYTIYTDYRFIITFDQSARNVNVEIKDGVGYSHTFYSTAASAPKVRNSPTSGFTGVRGFSIRDGTLNYLPHFQLDNFIVTEEGASEVEDWRALD